MQIHTTLELRNNRAASVINVVDFTSIEMQKITQYGAFLVEVGGKIEGFHNSEFLSFTLPTSQRSIYGGFPYTRYFDLGDHADAEKRAHVFSKVVESRIRGLRAALLSRVSTLPGDRAYTINNTNAPLPEFQTVTGSEDLTVDVLTHTFTLATLFIVAPNQFILNITNGIDASPVTIAASVQAYNVQTRALTVALSVAPPTGNYELGYTISVV